MVWNMTPEQPGWESGEDSHWMQGIPRDWPISEPEANVTPPKGSPLTQRQWENQVAQVLDDYNAGKISKQLMVVLLKDLKNVKIKS